VSRCIQCHHTDDMLVNDMCITCRLDNVDAAAGVTYRYFLSTDLTEEWEVTMQEWVAAERRAGFTNTLGHPERPGTAGFGTTQFDGLAGRIERVVPGE
jgi:hypothetical protein